MSRFLNILRASWAKLLRPIVQEFPLFIMTIMMLGVVGLLLQVHARVITSELTFYTIVSRLSLVCLYAYLLAWFVSVLRPKPRRVAKVVIYAVLVILCATDVFIFRNFKTHISPEILRLIAETNTRESTDFFSSFLLSSASVKTYLLILFLVVCIILGERFIKPIRAFLSHGLASVSLGLVMLALVAFGCYTCRIFTTLSSVRTTEDLSQWVKYGFAPTDPVSNLIYSSVSLRTKAREMQRAIQSTRQIEGQNIVRTSSDSLTIVLIIGESHIKSHSSLYGYPLLTNPALAAEGDNLYVFSDVVAPYNQTSSTLKNILSCSDMASGESWHEYPYLPAVFHQAGFKVMLWDNQQDTFRGQAVSFALNSFLYDPVIQQMSYDAVNDHSFQYDLDIVNSFAACPYAHTAPALAIIHLQGQHFNAKNRYPNQLPYDHFTGDSITRSEPWLTPQKKQEIAEYDNAVLYNDQVLKSVFDLYRDANAIVIYLSDHGEEIYDYRDAKGRTLQTEIDRQCARYQYEVPFVIWCSDQYKQRHPDTVSAIQRAVDIPFSIDRICHLLLHLGSISTTYYRPQFDILSPSWQPGKRLIADHYDYDHLK